MVTVAAVEEAAESGDLDVGDLVEFRPSVEVGIGMPVGTTGRVVAVDSFGDLHCDFDGYGVGVFSISDAKAWLRRRGSP